MYQKKHKLFLEPDDQCSDCIFSKDIEHLCPLMEALVVKTAYLINSPLMENCGFYQKEEKHLKVVK